MKLATVRSFDYESRSPTKRLYDINYKRDWPVDNQLESEKAAVGLAIYYFNYFDYFVYFDYFIESTSGASGPSATPRLRL